MAGRVHRRRAGFELPRSHPSRPGLGLTQRPLDGAKQGDGDADGIGDACVGGGPQPPADGDGYPWTPSDDGGPGGSYLDDLDPDVDNPYPWTPDDPTRPVR